MKMVVKFAHEKDTAGAHRYTEVDNKGNILKAADGAKVGSLYIRKDAINGDAPDKLTVTIEGK